MSGETLRLTDAPADLRRAAELLRDSSLSVLGVAQSVGYGSASQFSAAFHRQYGMTPAMYRKMSGPA